MPNAPRPQPRKPPAKQAQSSRPPSKPEKPDVGNLKLGKLPARPDAVKMKFCRYVKPHELPTPPEDFGHYGMVDPGWQMLVNDQLGCCVISGGEHEEMIWHKEAGTAVRFSDEVTVANYSAVGGYDGNPDTDNGCDMELAARWRRRHGLIDADGQAHKIVAYTALTPGNLSELALGAFLYGAVGMGVIVTEAQMDQFAEGQPWDYVSNSKEIGGHYVPVVGRKGGLYYVVTWGKLHPVTPRFIVEQCDEAIASFSQHMMAKNVSMEGFNDQLLIGDLVAITASRRFV
jgi:hypothetical protein